MSEFVNFGLRVVASCFVVDKTATRGSLIKIAQVNLIKSRAIVAEIKDYLFRTAADTVSLYDSAVTRRDECQG